jgi:ATP-dependent helicase Lhr and Lhr-like helicase
MNVGAIVESPMLKVRLGTPRKGPDGNVRPGGGRGGRVLGEVEEYFAETLTPGDTFLFAGEILRFEGIAETTCMVSRSSATNPKVPSYAGGKFPLSTFLAEGVRRLIADRAGWSRLHPQLAEWLEAQADRSVIPAPDQMLIETFPRGGKHYLVAYPFEGRLAHQTLGMLLTRRLERAGRKPLGFVANDYALSIWSLDEVADLDMAQLFAEDMLGDDLDAWLAESVLMKRTFRTCAVIAGMIERRFPGQEKTGRQITFSTDLIYDVLRSHEPDHVLLQAAWADAGEGLLDIRRLGDMLGRVKGRLVHIDLPSVSPFAVPLLLEIGVVPVHGAAQEAILADAEADLVAEAMA